MKSLHNISIEVKAIACTIIVIVAACCAFVAPDYIKQNKEKELQLKKCEARMDSLIATVVFAEKTYSFPPLDKIEDIIDFDGLMAIDTCYRNACEFARDSIMPFCQGNKVLNEKYDVLRYGYKNYDMLLFDYVTQSSLIALVYKEGARSGWSADRVISEADKLRAERHDFKAKVKAEVWDKI